MCFARSVYFRAIICLLNLLTSLTELSYVNNATEKNKKRNEREANLNNFKFRFTFFQFPYIELQYHTGIYNVNTEVLIQKRKHGRPSNKTSEQSPKRVNRTLNNETVFTFINEMINGSSVKELSVQYGISESLVKIAARLL